MRNKILLIFGLLFASKWATAQDSITHIIIPTAICDSGRVSFQLSGNDTITFQFYDRWGDIVRTYYSNTPLTAGVYSFEIFADSLPQSPYTYNFQNRLGRVKAGYIIFKKNCIQTKIKEVIKKESPLFYPNPTKNWLYFDSKTIKKMEIFTILGQKITSLETENDSFSLENFTEGVYIIKIYDEKNNLLDSQYVIKN